MTFQTPSNVTANFSVRAFNTHTFSFDDSEIIPESHSRRSIMDNNLLLDQENLVLEQNGYYLVYYPVTGYYHVTQLNMSWINLFSNVTANFCFGEYLIQIIGRITVIL